MMWIDKIVGWLDWSFEKNMAMIFAVVTLCIMDYFVGINFWYCCAFVVGWISSDAIYYFLIKTVWGKQR